ncbi:MAG: hypothetical protein IPF96_08115 [Rhodobacter sp.]|nr:hypothetical protein [Rhodobacter sp.]
MIRTPLVASAALVALSGLPTAATAFDLGGGLVATGEVKLEYTDSSNNNTAAAIGDITLAWRSGSVLGFDAALDSIWLDDGNDFTNLWAAVVLSTSFGDFAVGAPRPVTETLKVMPNISSSRLIDIEFGSLTASLTAFTSYFDNGMTPGLAFTSTAGNLRYGLSYHQIDDGVSTADLVTGAMVFSGGQTTYFIMGEAASEGSDDVVTLQIGALHQADRYALGANLAHVEFSTGNMSAGRLYGSYSLTPALSVKGDYLAITDSDDLLSLSAEYRFGQNGFVEGGVSVFGDVEVFDIGVGLKF